MAWVQRVIELPPKRRGCHLITDAVLAALPELRTFRVGVLHLFIQHTSASLTLNENADPTVRSDFEDVLNRLVPEDASYAHDDEGPDDLPAHVKSSLLGASVSIPIGAGGRLLLGTWQGVYLCEHRNLGGRRRVVATINGAC